MATQRYEYEVKQVILKESILGTGSGNLSNLESEINKMAKRGWKLHTIETSSSGSKGMFGGDRIQAVLVFERPVE